MRCKRADGTYYGTSGTCRKGKLAPKEVEPAPKPKKGKKLSLSPEKMKAGMEALKDLTSDKVSKGRVRKLKKAGLSDEEAMSVSLWLDTYNYTMINRSILDKDFREANPEAEIAAHYAESGIKKLKSYNTSDSYFRGKKKLLQGKDEPLVRGLVIPQGKLDDFLKDYKEGGTHTSNTFFSTTDLSKEHPLVAVSNVKFSIKSDKTGKGQGKALDMFHEGMDYFEGEVMFPPGSNFRVNKVTESYREEPPKRGFEEQFKGVPNTVFNGGKKPRLGGGLKSARASKREESLEKLKGSLNYEALEDTKLRLSELKGKSSGFSAEDKRFLASLGIKPGDRESAKQVYSALSSLPSRIKEVLIEMEEG